MLQKRWIPQRLVDKCSDLFVYLHVIKIGIKKWTKTCLKWHTVSEQIAFAAYFTFDKFLFSAG